MSASTSTPAASSTKEPQQYLTFVLGSETFALKIDRVREVLEVAETTRVPRTPDFMRGVINLRGTVVPIVDLKQKFEMGRTETTVDTCIIIVEVTIEGHAQVIGALADSVKEVVDLANEQVDPPPRMGASIRTDFLLGMCRSEDHFTMLLDIDRVFSEDELRSVRDSSASGGTDGEPAPAEADRAPEEAVAASS